jgi:hypothetical protein
MPKIFISYRREDSQYQADRLHAALKRVVGDPEQDIFIDVDNIPLGVDFVDHLDSKIAQCDVLLAVIGPNWLTVRDIKTGQRRLDDPRDFVRIEISSALKRGVPVAPVVLDGAPFPSEADLPDDIRALTRRNGVEVRRLSFDADVERLVRGLGLSLIDPHGSRAAANQASNLTSQSDLALSKVFKGLTQDDLDLRQRFFAHNLEHVPFMLVSFGGVATWAVQYVDEKGTTSFVNMGDFDIPADAQEVILEQLVVSNTTTKFNASLVDRQRMIAREFGESATHADFNDVEKAAALMGAVNVVDFLELRKVRNPEITAIDGVPHWNQGPFVTFKNEIARQGRAYFISSHDGRVVDDWFVVETISNHVIDLGCWYDDRPALVRIKTECGLEQAEGLEGRGLTLRVRRSGAR